MKNCEYLSAVTAGEKGMTASTRIVACESPEVEKLSVPLHIEPGRKVSFCRLHGREKTTADETVLKGAILPEEVVSYFCSRAGEACRKELMNQVGKPSLTDDECADILDQGAY